MPYIHTYSFVTSEIKGRPVEKVQNLFIHTLCSYFSTNVKQKGIACTRCLVKHNRSIIDLSKYQLSAQSLNIQQYKLHYTPQHVSSSTLLIIRRTNCITTASGIVTLCKQPYSMRMESGLSPLSTRILYGCLQRVTIPEAVVI